MKTNPLPLLATVILAVIAMGSCAASKAADPCLAGIPASLGKQLVLKYPNDRLPTTADSNGVNPYQAMQTVSMSVENRTRRQQTRNFPVAAGRKYVIHGTMISEERVVKP